MPFRMTQRSDPTDATSTRALTNATSEVLMALHRAKQDLVVEMEANLKQLQAILRETQRIAREMEAVLQQTKGIPDPQKLPANRTQEPVYPSKVGDLEEEPQVATLCEPPLDVITYPSAMPPTATPPWSKEL